MTKTTELEKSEIRNLTKISAISIPDLLANIDATLEIVEAMIEIHGKDTELGAEYAHAAATLETLTSNLGRIQQALIDITAANNNGSVQ